MVNISLFVIVWFMEETKIRKQLTFMKNSNLDFTFTAYEIINEKEDKIGYRKQIKLLNFEDL